MMMMPEAPFQGDLACLRHHNMSPIALVSLVSCAGLQENNAIALLDVERAAFRSIHALGLKNHNLPTNALDASDRDGPGGSKAAILKQQPVYGMYQPDEMASYRCVVLCK